LLRNINDKSLVNGLAAWIIMVERIDEDLLWAKLACLSLVP
jgi:hypothetical protein